VRLTALLAAALGVGLGAGSAWADHAIWSPLTAALVFGGLALLAGAVVVIVVTVLTRRDDSSTK